MMKSLMLKSLIALLSFCQIVLADINDDVENFIKNLYKSNSKAYTIKKVEIYNKKNIKTLNGWSAYYVKLDIELAKYNKNLKQRDIVFSDGVFLSSDLIDIKTNKSLKTLMMPSINESYYTKENLIAGDMQSKHKIVVFSDPTCPFCIDLVPDIIKFINKNKKEYALFYYHFPLTLIHKNALYLSKIMEIAKDKEKENVVLKTYEAYFENDMSESQVLDKFNALFDLKISKKDLNNEKIIKKVDNDIQKAEDLMIQSTPTVFIDGQNDKDKTKIMQLLGKQ